MTEQGTDRYGAEYKRTDNDFHVKYLEQDNGVCSVCHGTGAKIEIRYVVRNYESARVKKKICKNLQTHERSLWICPKCIKNFKQKSSVIREDTIEPQRTGKWIRNPDDTAGSGYFICSECGTDFYDVWKYCPNCGARMEGESR